MIKVFSVHRHTATREPVSRHLASSLGQSTTILNYDLHALPTFNLTKSSALRHNLKHKEQD